MYSVAPDSTRLFYLFVQFTGLDLKNDDIQMTTKTKEGKTRRRNKQFGFGKIWCFRLAIPVDTN